MKQITLLLVSVLSLFGVCSAWANNPDKCYWRMDGSAQHHDLSAKIPSNIKLKFVGVGQIMARADFAVVAPGVVWSGAKCPYQMVPEVKIAYEMAHDSAAQLEDGYTDVYKTGLKGVGIRFKTSTYGVVPSMSVSRNGNSVSVLVTAQFAYELVRTSKLLDIGPLKLDYKIAFRLNDWHAATIHGSGDIPVETDSYFSGCAGVRKDIKVLMSKTWTGELQSNSARTEGFDLNVRCTGLPAGTKLPVKVYFEGDSPSDGRLNLTSGGATGVEISLQNAMGAELPFSQSRAMSMEWMRSDAEGEIYNLPAKARYIQKPGTPVTVGRADAVLNYIIEYN
ncbi:type 1 fimbrial protein [Pseudomonas sp. ADAK18]|uniref:fimbrial protein n=1 Tax=Pseudomonas sp. ADAK18 TaxID=2730848 RepID=UPI0014635CE2|nr:fimbrial protein [Pseudomonas sp. ADAK18]QJI31246.1 type 1 fimbrial protein [Pseudomonas sp. ADAK18]